MFDNTHDYLEINNADITIDENKWIGINASNPRISFKGGSMDRINFQNADIEIDGGKWIGIGSTIERIEFDHVNDEINILGAKVGIGTNSPTKELDVNGDVLIDGSLEVMKDIMVNNINISDVINLKPRDAAPLNPETGDIYLNSIDEKLHIYIGGEWKTFAFE